MLHLCPPFSYYIITQAGASTWQLGACHQQELPQVSLLSGQTHVCHDKTHLLTKDKTFVMTKMVLVAAPANDRC